jgi:hypothetical protein
LLTSAHAVLVTPRYLATGRWRELLEWPASPPAAARSAAAPAAAAEARAGISPASPPDAVSHPDPVAVARAVRRLARLPLSPWRGTCLYRSVAVCLAYRFAGVPAVLRVGAAPGSGDGPLAHAWVEDADGTLLYERRDGFVPLRPAPDS